MAKANPVDLAIEHAGGMAALARKVGVSRQLVRYWRLKGRIPQWHVPRVAKATGLSSAQLYGIAA